jgi:hypothetical protein
MTSRVLTLAGYALLAAVAAGLEAWARRSHRLCTIGDAVAAVARHGVVRLFLLGGWLWLGWHLFVRVDHA